MRDRNKRRVAISLYHRGHLSLGDNRTRLGYSAYHWGLVVMSKLPSVECDTYDAADIPMLDPTTGEDRNPNRDWIFRRPQHDIDPAANGRLIGRIIVGKLPNKVSVSHIDSLLGRVPLPKKDVSPRESCVTWALAALNALQDEELAWKFDIAVFQDWTLAYGDECMKQLGQNNVCEYVTR